MTAVAGIWNNPNQQSASPTVARPAADSGSSSTNSSSTSTISANDFLTLLVTEMKNQDPTDATDPNQYINQLVSVNSLEQLIQINQTLSGDTATGSGTTIGTSPDAVSKQAVPAASAAAQGSPAMPASSASVTTGNLGVPAANSAAQRVAQALGGRANLNGLL